MKRFLKTKFAGKNQKGFSLVEVLCAVVLLALVATPILQALYSGMVVNNKSRKMLAAADLTSDTLEFVSSLAFKDFKYTESGTEITVPGLESYYFGKIDPATYTADLSTFKLRSSQLLYPGGPHAEIDTISYTTKSGWDVGTYNRTIKYKNVEMDGAKFYVIIETTAPKTKIVKDPDTGTVSSQTFEFSDLTSEKYYCYDVTVTVKDATDNSELCSASTTVPNRF